jgi:5'-3' exonuclease
VRAVEVHLVDGTYELFRHFYGKHPSRIDPVLGHEISAARGVVSTAVQLLEEGATHVGVATDHVIESFRNDLWPGYKTGEGIDPELWQQAHPSEEALRAVGVAVFAMVEVEADDAMGAAARIAAADDRVHRVVICTPDKDLGQCVGGKVVQLDRRNDKLLDAAAIREKFGVPPEAIPDYLALVGDTADGFPGLPGFGAKTAAALLARYGSIDAIPDDDTAWDVPVRGAAKLGATLRASRDDAALFRTIATLRYDAPVGVVDDWEWRGPDLNAWPQWCERFGSNTLRERVVSLRRARGF